MTDEEQNSQLLSYGWEQLYGAVRALAGAGTVQSRLSRAYQTRLHALESKNLPSESRQEFEDLMAKLCSGVPTGNEGRVDAYCQTLPDERAAEHAHTVVDLFNEVTEALAKSRQ